MKEFLKLPAHSLHYSDEFVLVNEFCFKGEFALHDKLQLVILREDFL
jgi:hypothetical protein